MKAIILLVLFCSLTVKGGVYCFDNADSWLAMASNPKLEAITNKVSICLWLSRDGNSKLNGVFVSKGQDLTTLTEQFSLGCNTTNRLLFYIYPKPAAGQSIWETSSFTYNNTNVVDFHAFSYNYADTNSVKWYVNGVLVTGAWTANIPTNQVVGNAKDLEIGQGRDASNPCGGGQRWTGYYSELAIWDEILTFQEFEAIRKSHVKGMAKQFRPGNLRLYVPLDTVPNYLSSIEEGTAGTSRFSDRANFGPYMRDCAASGVSDPKGAGERVCSYQPNE